MSNNNYKGESYRLGSDVPIISKDVAELSKKLEKLVTLSPDINLVIFLRDLQSYNLTLSDLLANK